MSSIKNHKEYKEIFYDLENCDVFNISNDTRKFEIDLYWKRSNYFILFIGATLTAYLTVYGLKFNVRGNNQEIILYLLNCVGIISTWTWLLSLKGSKYWQENWEKHVSHSQNEKVGPLFDYVHVVENNQFPPKNLLDESIYKVTSSSPYSVSKLNMLLSSFILGIWINIFIFISNKKLISDQEQDISDRIIKISLFVITVLYIYLLKKYGASSFKEQMTNHTTNGTIFFKLKKCSDRGHG